jgi:hypothetical protein
VGSTLIARIAAFSGGTVHFGGATFAGGTMNFGGATFSGGTVRFFRATFSGGIVNFGAATFSGGTVDLARPLDYTSAHINMFGRYTFPTPSTEQKLRPLRDPDSAVF